SGPCVPGRAGPRGPALLHQLGLAALHPQGKAKGGGVRGIRWALRGQIGSGSFGDDPPHPTPGAFGATPFPLPEWLQPALSSLGEREGGLTSPFCFGAKGLPPLSPPTHSVGWRGLGVRLARGA